MVGWVNFVLLNIAGLAICVLLLRRSIRGWYGGVFCVAASLVLIKPILTLISGDMSRWLPDWFWTDSNDGTGASLNQIFISSMWATVWIPVALSSLLLLALQGIQRRWRAS